MIQLFQTSPTSWPVILVTVIYLLSESISIFDTRIIQAKRNGFLRENEAEIPDWTGIFAFSGWLAALGLILLSWKFAVVVYVVTFVLKVLPVLENIGAFLLTPFVGKETASKVNIVAIEQKKAAKKLKEITRSK